MLALARRTALAVVVAAVALSGCSLAGGSCSGLGAGVLGAAPAEASCASGIEYDGHFYLETTGKVRLPRGHALTGAVIPGCNDTGSNCQMADEPDLPVQAWAVRGVDPRVMVLSRGLLGKPRVFLRMHVDVRRFLHRVDGRWELRRTPLPH